MKRVLITGAAGFVGANLARRLLHDGHSVCLVIKPDSHTWRIDSIKNDCQISKISLIDFEAVNNQIVSYRPEWIFHLAVHGAYSWQNNWQEMISVNINGTMNVVEAALKVGFEALINTGSSSEYGFKDHAPLEDEPVEPNSYYAVTKVAATNYCRFIAHDRHVNISTLRLYSAYGPYEDPNRLMPTLIRQGMEGHLPPLVDPSIARDYIYIDDVVDAYIASAKNNKEPGAIYNIGTGKQTNIAEIVDIARQTFDIKDEPKWGSMDNRMWDTNVWLANNEKAMKFLGWSPVYNIQSGFNKMANCFSVKVKG
jgi:dolichol-phosphate mannosyltransferase